MERAPADEAETSWNNESWDEAEYAHSLERSSTSHASDDTDFGGTRLMDDDGPRFNIDGTPMLGSFDINGNPFGVTSSPVTHDAFGSDSFGSSWPSDDSFGSSSSSGSFGSDW